MGIFNIEDQFSFYGAYHTNKVNILIHILCVPLIFLTSMILLHANWNTSYFNLNLPSSLAAVIPELEADGVVGFTGPFLVSIAYATYFVLLEPVAGLLYAPFVVGAGQFAKMVYQQEDAMRIAGGVFTLAWIAQFVGHGKFEGRAPALFKNLFQSIVLALFFVFLEVLFHFGYRPELNKRVQNRIGKAVLEYRQEQAIKAKAKAKKI